MLLVPGPAVHTQQPGALLLGLSSTDPFLEPGGILMAQRLVCFSASSSHGAAQLLYVAYGNVFQLLKGFLVLFFFFK